jgi:hypothetical protein
MADCCSPVELRAAFEGRSPLLAATAAAALRVGVGVADSAAYDRKGHERQFHSDSESAVNLTWVSRFLHNHTIKQHALFGMSERRRPR